MLSERLTDIDMIDHVRIDNILSDGKAVTIQFSRPPYDRELLVEIDSLCVKYGDKIEVRFYGHYSTEFDASCLDFVPNVRWLSIDCLTRMCSIERLANLCHLRILSLGVFELNTPKILANLRIKELRDLRLCETRKNEIDLSPLAQCQKLVRLHISAHTSGFSVLKDLRSLESLNLASIPKKQSLEIIGNIPHLSRLRLILGGRMNIDEISHATLKELEIVRVLGLTDLGNLSRFPMLNSLRIEDQIRLVSIDTDQLSCELRQLALWNCKNLRLTGMLTHLTKLEDLGIGNTSVDFASVLDSPLPSSLQTVRFRTGKRKVDEFYRAKLDALGYSEFSKRKAFPV